MREHRGKKHHCDTYHTDTHEDTHTDTYAQTFAVSTMKQALQITNMLLVLARIIKYAYILFNSNPLPLKKSQFMALCCVCCNTDFHSECGWTGMCLGGAVPLDLPWTLLLIQLSLPVLLHPTHSADLGDCSIFNPYPTVQHTD